MPVFTGNTVITPVVDRQMASAGVVRCVTLLGLPHFSTSNFYGHNISLEWMNRHSRLDM